jgi:dihydroorotase
MGSIGLETALPIALTVLYHHFHLPLWRIVELLSSAPARVFGLEGLGALADVTIFDPEKKWTYDASQSRSKSRNTPYDGWSFTGKVVATVVAGRVIYSD